VRAARGGVPVPPHRMTAHQGGSWASLGRNIRNRAEVDEAKNSPEIFVAYWSSRPWVAA